MDAETEALILQTHIMEKVQMRMRIAELEAAHAGQKEFIAKQASMVRALQRRLNTAGLDSSIPGNAERTAADREANE